MSRSRMCSAASLLSSVPVRPGVVEGHLFHIEKTTRYRSVRFKISDGFFQVFFCGNAPAGGQRLEEKLQCALAKRLPQVPFPPARGKVRMGGGEKSVLRVRWRGDYEGALTCISIEKFTLEKNAVRRS
jgi:hypothetical protein